jgi:hypothetical protein
MFLHAWTYSVTITVIFGTKTIKLSSYVIESQVSRPEAERPGYVSSCLDLFSNYLKYFGN